MKRSTLKAHHNKWLLYLRKKAEIESLYDTRRAVQPFRISKTSTGNYYDPVKEAVFLIDEKKEELYTFLYQILEEEESIFQWLDTIQDHHFRTIVIWRYIVGYTWERVDYEMSRGTGETYTGSASATYFTRYINKHPEILEDE